MPSLIEAIPSNSKTTVDAIGQQSYSTARRAAIGGSIGYQGIDIGEEYIVSIIDYRPRMAGEDEHITTGVSKRETKRSPIVIRALLQEKFEITTEAKWNPLSIATVMQSFSGELLSLAGLAPVNRWSSRRHYDGTTPLSFTLNLKFAAEQDAEREVLLPIKEIQRMILPYVGDRGSGHWFLAAPGPNIYQWKWGKEYFSKPEAMSGQSTPGGVGEVVDIKIGKLYYIRKVILQKAVIGVHPVFAEGGMPLVATAAVTFETFEIMTKNALDTDLYNPLRTQVQGYAGTDAGPVKLNTTEGGIYNLKS